MYIIIVGGGKVGSVLSKKLYSDKHSITLIEKDPDTAEKLAEGPGILVIQGDGCDPKVLEEAGATRADVLAAVTGDDEDNLVICQLAKERFEIHRTVGRVNDPNNERTFIELGVDIPIDATAIIAKVIEGEVSFTDFVNLLSFKRGKLAIVRVDLPDDSPVIDKQLQEIKLPQDSVLVSLIRKDEVIVPKGDTRLVAGDDIIALTKIENEQQLIQLLVGKL